MYAKHFSSRAYKEKKIIAAKNGMVLIVIKICTNNAYAVTAYSIFAVPKSFLNVSIVAGKPFV